MKFAEIKNNQEILSHMRWDLTPETANTSGYEIKCHEDLDRLNKLLAEKVGYYFYVDVWNCQAHLALMQNKSDCSGIIHKIEDFDSPLLEKAVYEIGSITTSGWYPLSKRLMQLLKRKLGIESE
jgi:hypothetical protein